MKERERERGKGETHRKASSLREGVSLFKKFVFTRMKLAAWEIKSRNIEFKR